MHTFHSWPSIVFPFLNDIDLLPAFRSHICAPPPASDRVYAESPRITHTIGIYLRSIAIGVKRKWIVRWNRIWSPCYSRININSQDLAKKAGKNWSGIFLPTLARTDVKISVRTEDQLSGIMI